MRIAFICDFNPFTQSSAIANRYEGLLQGLSKQGVKVDLINLNSINKKSNTKIQVLEEIVLGCRLDKVQQKNLRAVLIDDYDYIWIASGSAVRRYILKYHHICKPKLFMEFSEFQQLYKRDKDTNILRKWQAHWEYVTTRNLLKHINCVAVMTKVLEPYYKQMTLPDTRFLHLPMTVNLSRFQQVSDANDFKKPYIAFSGTYTNIKDGVLILIKAFERIKGKYPDVSLFLAGFYHPDMNEQKRYLNEHNLNDRVKHLGVLDRTQIPSFVCNASVLALSRPDSHQAQGGFPTKLGEYLATGNPVCVTKVGEIPDYLEDNKSAFMATPGDVDSFADALDRALSNPDNAKRVGLNGRKVAERCFDSDIQAKRLFEFLSQK